MDNLVLVSVAREISRAWTGSILEEILQESATRFRLRCAGEGPAATLIVSLRPEAAWVGRPWRRWEGPRWTPDPFVTLASKALVGRRILAVEHATSDRALILGASEGRGLVLELATHGGNLVLLGEGSRVEAALRHGRSASERLKPGTPYTARPLPAGVFDPFVTGASDIDAFLDSRSADDPPFEILRRKIWGVGTAAAGLVVEEAEESATSVGVVLERRIAEVVSGRAEPVIEAPEPPEDAVERGAFLERSFRLLPWRPPTAPPGCELVSRGTPAATAGLFHECVEAAERLRQRIAALGSILRTERMRTEEAGRRAAEGAEALGDPAAWGRRAEALLAGLSAARRVGNDVVVPDPYDPGGATLTIPAEPGVALPRLADDLFRRQRRAQRGIAASKARAASLGARRERLEALEARGSLARSERDASELEGAMREEGIAVGLARSTRAGRKASLSTRPAVAGVRMVTSVDGLSILVGKTARDNDRLTFKIAAPEDVWLHAAGATGAHVVIRSPAAGASPPETTLLEAARLAAWFSDARGHAHVDVHWTRRKHVRRARGASPGTVVLKKFQTVRVRPVAPRLDDGSPPIGRG